MALAISLFRHFMFILRWVGRQSTPAGRQSRQVGRQTGRQAGRSSSQIGKQV